MRKRPQIAEVVCLKTLHRRYGISVWSAQKRNSEPVVVIVFSRWATAWPLFLESLKLHGLAVELAKDAKGRPLVCIACSEDADQVTAITNEVLFAKRGSNLKAMRFYVDHGWLQVDTLEDLQDDAKEHSGQSNRLFATRTRFTVWLMLPIIAVIIVCAYFMVNILPTHQKAMPAISTSLPAARNSARPAPLTLQVIRSYLVEIDSSKMGDKFDSDVAFDPLMKHHLNVDILKQITLGGMVSVKFKITGHSKPIEVTFEKINQEWVLAAIKNTA